MVIGTLLIALSVLDTTFTRNDERHQQINLIWVLGGIGMMVGAAAFGAAERKNQPRAPVQQPYPAPHLPPPQAYPQHQQFQHQQPQQGWGPRTSP